jgi:formylglycine-generating enzyme required for sulfatase activity
MVVVPAGQFIMGSPPSETGRDSDEGPPHLVKIARPFAVGKYEVSFDEWDACVAERGCGAAKDEGWGRGRNPVINVSYDQAVGYTEWLSEKTGKKYRLLSEAEWEYAARAGSDKARYWGSSPDRACQFANVANQRTKAKYNKQYEGYYDKYPPFDCDDGITETATVGSFKPNAFGLYDMLGNVWEWVEDCYNQTYDGAPTDGSTWGTGDCSRRVVRGGGWSNRPASVRSAARNWFRPTDRGGYLGFRVARTLP